MGGHGPRPPAVLMLMVIVATTTCSIEFIYTKYNHAFIGIVAWMEIKKMKHWIRISAVSDSIITSLYNMTIILINWPYCHDPLAIYSYQ